MNIVPQFNFAIVTKQVFADANFLTPLLMHPLSVSGSGSTGFVNLMVPTGLIYVEDTFIDATAAPAILDNFTNSFKLASDQTTAVPGPLPLLGVGAAFGFSRNLRKRITRSNSQPFTKAID